MIKSSFKQTTSTYDITLENMIFVDAKIKHVF